MSTSDRPAPRDSATASPPLSGDALRTSLSYLVERTSSQSLTQAQMHKVEALYVALNRASSGDTTTDAQRHEASQLATEVKLAVPASTRTSDNDYVAFLLKTAERFIGQ